MIVRNLDKKDYFQSIFFFSEYNKESIPTYEIFSDWFDNIPSNQFFYVLEEKKKIIGIASFFIETNLLLNSTKYVHILSFHCLNKYKSIFFFETLFYILKNEFDIEEKVILNLKKKFSI